MRLQKGLQHARAQRPCLFSGNGADFDHVNLLGIAGIVTRTPARGQV
jgi:hypothetical protein